MAIYGNQTGEMMRRELKNFNEDVIKGLQSEPKYLQSKYFYDAEGDRLFQEIMKSPEYYVTRSEMEIFTTRTAALAKALTKKNKTFDIVELGAGDAVKSTHLLRHLSATGVDYTYYPIDISSNVIALLKQELPERIPGIRMQGLHGEYLEMIGVANKISTNSKVLLFLGSNIGNFTPQYVNFFLLKLNEQMNKGDLLLIGADLKKNPKIILAAYNDAAGVTKAFNLNLLERINRELDADFDVTAFDHYPTYDPITGACRSYIISLRKQQVRIGSQAIEFLKNEAMYMELSHKYDVAQINAMAKAAGFLPQEYFFDSKNWFVDALWEKP